MLLDEKMRIMPVSASMPSSKPAIIPPPNSPTSVMYQEFDGW
jgi:hypothetical protein